MADCTFVHIMYIMYLPLSELSFDPRTGLATKVGEYSPVNGILFKRRSRTWITKCTVRSNKPSNIQCTCMCTITLH